MAPQAEERTSLPLTSISCVGFHLMACMNSEDARSKQTERVALQQAGLRLDTEKNLLSAPIPET